MRALASGYLADFVLLSGDILEIPPAGSPESRSTPRSSAGTWSSASALPEVLACAAAFRLSASVTRNSEETRSPEHPEKPRDTMSKIHRLSSSVIDRIAAGEVVERPASVVKELIENALDAGAHRVEIEIEGGGVARILVRDDGAGMSGKTPVSLERHATSRFRRTRILRRCELRIPRRGSSVDRVRVEADADDLRRIDSGGHPAHFRVRRPHTAQPAARPRGPTFVEGLFARTPAAQVPVDAGIGRPRVRRGGHASRARSSIRRLRVPLHDREVLDAPRRGTGCPDPSASSAAKRSAISRSLEGAVGSLEAFRFRDEIGHVPRPAAFNTCSSTAARSRTALSPGRSAGRRATRSHRSPSGPVPLRDRGRRRSTSTVAGQDAGSVRGRGHGVSPRSTVIRRSCPERRRVA